MPILKTLQKSFQIPWLMLLRNTTSRKILWAGLAFLVVTIILLPNYSLDEYDLVPGQISPRDITAPRTMVFTDEAKTAELKQQAAAAVQKVYQQDDSALQNTQKNVSSIYAKVKAVRADQSLNEQEKVKRLREVLQPELGKEQRWWDKLSDRVLLSLLRADDRGLDQLQVETDRILGLAMSKTITEETLDTARQEISAEVQRLKNSSELRTWVEVVAQSVVQPNMILNREDTRRKIEEAQNKVLPVQRTVKQGQIIVRKGNPVSPEDIQVLRQLGLQRTKSPWLTFIGLGLLVLITMGVTMAYLYLFYRPIWQSESRLVLLSILVIITLLAARGVTAIQIGSRPEISSLVGYMVPVAAGSMLIAILLDTKVAVFVTMILSIFVGILTEGNQLFFAVVALVGGIVGIYSVSKLNQSSDLAKAGIYIGLVNIGVIIALGLINHESSTTMILVGSVMGVVNGILSSVLTNGFLPYLESAFGITSAVKLLELASPNQPLLKRLLVEAPGTYHHSIIVGNLAEAAA